MTWGRGFGAALAVVYVLLVLGCGMATVRAPDVEVAPPAVIAPAADAGPLAAAKATRDDLIGRLASAERRVQTLQQEADEAPVRATARWLSWLGALVTAAGVAAAVAAIWLPVPFGKRLGLGIAAAGLATVLVAQGLVQLLPWIAYLWIGALVLLVAAAVWYVVARLNEAGTAAGFEMRRYAGQLDHTTRTALDRASLSDQGRARPIIDRWLGVDPSHQPHPKTAAMRTVATTKPKESDHG